MKYMFLINIFVLCFILLGCFEGMNWFVKFYIFFKMNMICIFKFLVKDNILF